VPVTHIPDSIYMAKVIHFVLGCKYVLNTAVCITCYKQGNLLKIFKYTYDSYYFPVQY
jgi:hypothetical protein